MGPPCLTPLTTNPQLQRLCTVNATRSDVTFFDQAEAFLSSRSVYQITPTDQPLQPLATYD
ncbi:MAG: hypothetical protein KDK65_03610, partial [Chlamydiia bacterium]|nr:hypothetical protein [Chlamydiia bacterium]